MNVLDLSEQEIQRRNSLDELRKMGINPYPAAEYKVTAYSDDIKANFNEEDKREVCIAGRLMGRRVMGKASFAELMDSKGRIQVYVTRDDVCPGEDKTLYNTVFKKLLDLGDFIGVKGFVFRTQTGEISVHAQAAFFFIGFFMRSRRDIFHLGLNGSKNGLYFIANYDLVLTAFFYNADNAV